MRNSVLRRFNQGARAQSESPVTSASVYASKLSATLDGKNEFYENLAAIIGSIPRKEQIILLADFNA